MIVSGTRAHNLLPCCSYRDKINCGIIKLNRGIVERWKSTAQAYRIIISITRYTYTVEKTTLTFYRVICYSHVEM
jgi:hypothetical protein